MVPIEFRGIEHKWFNLKNSPQTRLRNQILIRTNQTEFTFSQFFHNQAFCVLGCINNNVYPKVIFIRIDPTRNHKLVWSLILYQKPQVKRIHEIQTNSKKLLSKPRIWPKYRRRISTFWFLWILITVKWLVTNVTWVTLSLTRNINTGWILLNPYLAVEELWFDNGST